ncbi:MAG: cytochrome c3 family protein [Nitrospirae bacterium]|nr:cytochrome c3 family protein [Nitrospirota bacterium]
MKTRLVILTIVAVTLLAAGVSFAGIALTKHNLSSAAGANSTIKSTGAGSTDQLCIFCHTPHRADTTSGPSLWNRNNATAVGGYTLYGSGNKTLGNSTVSNPNPASRACLSCHDGNNAINAVINTAGVAGTFTMPDVAGRLSGNKLDAASGYNLGTNLSNDHPISVTYDITKSSLNTLTAGTGVVRVTSDTTGQGTSGSATVECTSCHDPHTSASSYFLRATTAGSKLCLVCHNK